MSKKDKENKILGMSRRTATMVFVVVGILILLIGGVMALSWLKDNSAVTNEPQEASKEEKAARDARVERAKREGAIMDDASAALKSGNFEEADKIYQEAIESEKEVTKKIQLRIDQSTLLFSSGYVDEAIAAALEAEKISDDKFLVADWLSRLYESEGDYTKAKEYYQLALKWVNSATNTARLDKAHFEKQIARVAKLEKKS